MLLNIGRSVALVFVLLVIASCKNIVETPVLGTAKPVNAAALSGAWNAIGAEEQVAFEIQPQGEQGWYMFSFQEIDKRMSGRLRVGFLGERLVLNIDLKSLEADGSRVFNLSVTRFLLVGATFAGAKLVVAPVNMEVFEERMAAYFDGVPRDFGDSCEPVKDDRPTANGFCRRFWASTKVIALTESEAFHHAFLSNYDDIFPTHDALIFTREN